MANDKQNRKARRMALIFAGVFFPVPGFLMLGVGWLGYVVGYHQKPFFYVWPAVLLLHCVMIPLFRTTTDLKGKDDAKKSC